MRQHTQGVILMSLKGEIDGVMDGVVNLVELHDRIKGIAPLSALTRIAVAVYDPERDMLRTFIDSTMGECPLSHYVARLGDVPSLVALARAGGPRVVDDLKDYVGDSEHSRKLLDHGYRSSYTLPLMQGDALQGFLFFNAATPGFFTPERLSQLWPYAQIARLIAVLELDKIRLIQAAVKTVRQISYHRDEETGSHLERMSRYGRLIAEGLAEPYRLSDEYVEFLYRFSPLHDVGKVAIPDSILLKPGPLDAPEYALMQAHVDKGRQIIDMMLKEFGMGQVPHIDMLHNIVAYHHECWDGSGYPYGLSGDQIPLEARIAAVADVFDALTSNRPYKKAWSNAEAFAYLRDMRGSKFDPACVEAMLQRAAEVEEIQAHFAETIHD